MTDSQKPDYHKPWCWKCQEHTHFKTITRTHHDEHGTRRRTQNVCAICGKSVFRPAAVDFAYYGKVGRRCVWVYFAIAVSCILPLVYWGIDNLADDAQALLVVGSVVVVFLIIPCAMLVWASRKYATWKTWAEERGWQEPPKEKRAWVPK